MPGPLFSVLIVEDEDDARELYALAFEAAGFRAVSAESIADALGALRDETIDAIVTDYDLPDGNGLAMLEVAVRARILRTDVPAVLCTACSQLRHPSGRVLTIFIKPVDMETLVGTVREAILEVQKDSGPGTREMAS